MPLDPFAVGQQVRLKGRWGQPPRTPELFRVTALLPVRDNLRHYRIRSDEEPHERVAPEDALEAVPASPAGRPRTEQP